MSQAKRGKYIGKDNPNFGNHWTEEQKMLASIRMKEKFEDEDFKNKMIAHLNPMYGEDNPMFGNHRFSGENNPMYGKKQTQETRDKIGNANRNPSEETREKMRLAAIANMTSERKEYLKSINLGRKATDEARNKMSISQKNRWTDDLKDAYSQRCTGSGNPRARRVIRLSDGKLYSYLAEAAQDNNVCVDTLRSRCKKHKEFMYYDEWLTEHND